MAGKKKTIGRRVRDLEIQILVLTDNVLGARVEYRRYAERAAFWQDEANKWQRENESLRASLERARADNNKHAVMAARRRKRKEK